VLNNSKSNSKSAFPFKTLTKSNSQNPNPIQNPIQNLLFLARRLQNANGALSRLANQM